MKKAWKAAALLLVAAALLASCSSKSGHEGGHGSTNASGGGKENGAASTTGGIEEESAGHNENAGGHAHGSDTEEVSKLGAADVEALWTLDDGAAPRAEQDTLIRVAIESGGLPVEAFDVSHEKQMHMIVVSKDLSYFSHIHPEYREDGVFEVNTSFPAGGEYKLIADFVPAGSSAMNKMEWVHVGGAEKPSAAIEPDRDLTQVVEGKEISLTLEGVAAGKEAMLTYTIADAATEQPITDLEPYLGAVGHVVILTADAEQYLHVHPMDESGSGPEARFMTTFPKSGVYKVWAQFQQQGKVFTVPFVIQVP